jgi:putative transposase
MEKKRLSKEDKLAILKEASEKGVEVTIRKHGVYPSTFYNWRKKYQLEGESGFADQARKRKDQQYMRQLEDEVGLLKQLLAERDIEIALRD